MALEMRQRCERCAWPLAPDEDGAFICSYESTFCATCANALNGICPDCNAELVRRPRRNRQKGTAGPATAE